MRSEPETEGFEPKVIGFLCHWCSYEGADSAGRAQRVYPANLGVVRVMCSGRIDPQFILEAFSQGADGVVILACPLGDCHYKEGNFQALRRYTALKKVLVEFGIEKERLRIDWISAGDGEGFAAVASEFVERIRLLGPLL